MSSEIAGQKNFSQTYGGFDMKKTFALPLVAALLLAACSNPADNSALYAPVVPTVSVGSGEQETAAQTPAKKGEAISWGMDLDGYEEIPKDSTYGINWVYMPKEMVDANANALIRESGKIKLKPVEFHANTADFKFAYIRLGQCQECTGAYKCAIYFKTGEDVVYEVSGGVYSCVSENVSEADLFNVKFQRSHYQRGEDTLETKTTAVTGAEEFKRCYGQY